MRPQEDQEKRQTKRGTSNRPFVGFTKKKSRPDEFGRWVGRTEFNNQERGHPERAGVNPGKRDTGGGESK